MKNVRQVSYIFKNFFGQFPWKMSTYLHDFFSCSVQKQVIFLFTKCIQYIKKIEYTFNIFWTCLLGQSASLRGGCTLTVKCSSRLEVAPACSASVRQVPTQPPFYIPWNCAWLCDVRLPHYRAATLFATKKSVLLCDAQTPYEIRIAAAPSAKVKPPSVDLSGHFIKHLAMNGCYHFNPHAECVLDGSEYEDGSERHPEDPCSSCKCEDRDPQCTHVHCPPITCLHPTMTAGN